MKYFFWLEFIFLVNIFSLEYFFYNFKFEVKYVIGDENSIINYHKLIKTRHILLLVRLLVFISLFPKILEFIFKHLNSLKPNNFVCKAEGLMGNY